MRYAVNVFENITEMKRAELSTSFLAESSRVLASSLDYAQTLAKVAELAVPQIADWCAVDIVQRGRAAPARGHASPQRRAAAAGRAARPAPTRPTPTTPPAWPRCIRTGRAIVLSDIPPATLAAYAHDDEHLQLLRAINPTAVIVVPMITGTKSIGAITLLWSDTARRLSRSDLSLAEELGRRAGAAVENARSFAERTRIAEVLQRALLPAFLPTIPGAQIEARYAASGELNEVGGDFYDVFEYDRRRWMLVIGDVCGKGPGAASVTALARHTLRAGAMHGCTPTRMLEMLHSALLRDPGGDLCTVCLVLVTPADTHARLTVALAGHPPPLLAGTRGEARPIGELGTLLGLIEPVVITEQEARLEHDETLLLYTDGLPEARGPSGILGEAGLRRLSREGATMPLPSMLEHIERGAIEHADGRAQDDIALLALRLAR